MSLLHRGTDQVTVFAEVTKTDADGNTITVPGTVGVLARAVVQPLSSTEDDESTTSRYRLRLVGWNGGLLGGQSAVEWNGKRYAIDGEPRIYNGSRRTTHVDYRRSASEASAGGLPVAGDGLTRPARPLRMLHRPPLISSRHGASRG
ncbi:hypothetical protein KL864_34520 [Mycolicibacterium goodii]|uniref:hypothetical protein n=1 Tax=Mycolicibacterium goodii TaxID=134601 RepID=UPI001BDCE2DD|nr:hypothetical protein [Mycolicibacterium goodii]MBU8820977.1 hypothetical protein [Mycolicibacterium goodii]